MMQMPTLETERLQIRALTREDELACHQLYVDIDWADRSASDAANRESKREWLEWTVRNYVQLAALSQPPYGERAVVARSDGSFVGLVGFVPWLAPFAQLASFGGRNHARFSPEVGLFWATSPERQRSGYAAEAAAAMIAYAFDQLSLARIVAGTEHTNAASLAVMRKLRMRIESNPFAEPEWFQAVGILERDGPRPPGASAASSAAAPLVTAGREEA